MTGRLASPANWQPQPERSIPRHRAGGLSGGAGRTGVACHMCCCWHRGLPLLCEDVWHPACHPLHQQTLAARERLLGPDHPHTLASRNNLALAYQAAGRTE